MEQSCYRCNAPIDQDAPFCPACGAPQIRVSTQEPSTAVPETTGEPLAHADRQPGPALQPGGIQWKIFLRTAWPLAAFAGLTVAFSVIGLLVVLPVSVLLGCGLYRRRHIGPLRASQGARLGLTMGLISFAAFATLSGIAIASNDAVHQEVIQAMTQAASRSPDPQARQLMLSWINSPHGFAVLIAVGFVFLMFIFLVFTAISGAVAAATFGHKKA